MFNTLLGAWQFLTNIVSWLYVQSLGQEDSLEKEMATRCSILAWRIPWIEGTGGPQSTELQESDTTSQQNHPCKILHIFP